MINQVSDFYPQEEIIKVEGIDICVEAFGNPENPALLLIMGASASMTWWDSDFCKKLASSGRFVIRYDNRDVGRSTFYPPGNPQYSVIDMVNDSIKVLDYYKIEKAHFVGMSLGGMITQLAALIYPERVLTVTMIASGVWDDRPELPPISEKILSYHSNAANVKWEDKKSVLEYMVGGWKLLNGSKHPFDEKRAQVLAETEYNRANNLMSMFNHALLKGGKEYYGKSNQIKAPALVIHGTEDPVLPFEHARELINQIPNSELLILEGSGHEMHYNEWDTIINAIAKHTEKK